MLRKATEAASKSKYFTFAFYTFFAKLLHAHFIDEHFFHFIRSQRFHLSDFPWLTKQPHKAAALNSDERFAYSIGMNNLARVVYQRRGRTDARPLLTSLHWLPILSKSLEPRPSYVSFNSRASFPLSTTVCSLV